MYEKEMKHNRNNLEFQFVNQELNNIFWFFIRLKSTYRFLFRE